MFQLPTTVLCLALYESNKQFEKFILEFLVRLHLQDYYITLVRNNAQKMKDLFPTRFYSISRCYKKHVLK